MEVPAHLIDDWRSWPFELRERPTVEATLPSETNSVYRLSSSAGSLVLRMNSPDAPGVDRAQEAAVMSRIAGRSFFRCDYALSVDKGYLVTALVPGSHPSPNLSNALLRQLGHSLADLHAVSIDGLTTTDPRTSIEDYAAELSQDQQTAIRGYLTRMDTLEPSAQPPVLCHFDLLPPNLLVSDAGDAWTFLDWEFAAAGDPLTDIATVAEGLELSDVQLQALQAGYGHPVDGYALRVTRALLRLLWLAWRLHKHGNVSGVADELAAVERLLDSVART